jgi:hypothetical protein
LSIAPDVSNLEPWVFWVGKLKQATRAIWLNFNGDRSISPKTANCPQQHLYAGCGGCCAQFPNPSSYSP